MPNQPKTPHRAVRIPDELWSAVGQQAEAEGTTRSAIINRLLREWTESKRSSGGTTRPTTR